MYALACSWICHSLPDMYAAEWYLKEAAQESLALHEEGSVHYNRFAHLVEKGVDFEVDNVVSQEEAWREVGTLLNKYQVWLFACV
jgi:hypothetical protein